MLSFLVVVKPAPGIRGARIARRTPAGISIGGGGVNYTGRGVPVLKCGTVLLGCGNVNEMNLTFSAYTRVMRVTTAHSIGNTSQSC